MVSFVVKLASFILIIARRNRNRWPQRDARELRRAIAILFHQTKSRVMIVQDRYMVYGAKMQIGEHVAGRKTRDEKIFRIVARWVAAKAGIA